jgi:DNA-binding transcriptional LysR family regulator
MRLRIDLRQLECFVAIAEEGSFRAAAERLHMSQPPLSRQIKQLETELGVPLLTRDPQGASLTAAGKAFVAEAKKTLLQPAGAVAAARRFARGKPHRLRIGYTTVLDSDVFPSLEPAFRKVFPDGSLEFSGHLSVELMRRLRRGALDVALIGLPSDTGELRVEPLYREPLVAVVPSRHPLARHKLLSLKQLADYSVFWPQRRLNPGYFDYYEAVFERLAFAPRRRLVEPEDHHVLLAEVAKGRGIGFVPKSMTKVRRTGATFRPLKEKDLWIGFGIAYSNELPRPGMDVLLQLIRRKLKGRRPGGD